MGYIADFCEICGFDLKILAAYSGILPSLLFRMDRDAPRMPEDIWLMAKSLCDARQEFLKCVKANLDGAGKGEGSKISGIAIVYSGPENYLEKYDLSWNVHRHFFEYAKAHFPPGYKLILVEFDNHDYRAWLGDRPDDETIRMVWAFHKVSDSVVTDRSLYS